MAYERMDRERFIQHYMLKRAGAMTGAPGNYVGEEVAKEAEAAWDAAYKGRKVGYGRGQL